MELIGSHEIADMLGVTRQRVQQLATAGRLPKPVAKLRGGWVWQAAAIRKWARAQGRLNA